MASWSQSSDDVTTANRYPGGDDVTGDMEDRRGSSMVHPVNPCSSVSAYPGLVGQCGPLDMARLAEAVNHSQTSHLQPNSEVTIDFEAPRFVLTDVQDDVMDVLEDKGVVVLTGGPGCGKSYQGQAVLRHYRERGYTPYTLRSFTDWDSHVGPDTRSVVLADGLFGETLVDKAQHTAWTQIRKTATALTAQGHCKLVITVYPHVLRKLQQLENGTRSPLLDPVVVSLPAPMDTTVKTHLLDVHLKQLDLPEDRQREVVEEVLHKDVSGPVFAWCCDWMVRHWHSAQHPTDIFSQPAEAYVPLLRRLLLDKECGETMAAVLALAMRGLGGFLHDPRRVQSDLQELRFHGNLSDYRLEEHADLLKGFILAHDGYGFTSRVLYDAAGLALGRTYSVPVLLQVCDVGFLVNYVTTDPQAELTVIVGDKPSLRQLYQQRIQQMMTKTRVDQQVTVPEELVRHLLIINNRQSWRQTAKSLVKELAKTKMKLETRIKYKWPKGQFTSCSAQKSFSRLQTQGACYLDAPSKPIPRSLLSVSVQEDEVSVDLAGQHLYLVLRLLTDTERDEQDDDGNTVFHLAALAGLWNILVMPDRESMMISNKQHKTPIQMFRKKLQQSQGFWAKSVPAGNKLWLESFEACITEWKAGDTALHWAVEKGKALFVYLLIQHGASVNEKNEDGETALHRACEKYGGTDIVGELLQHGAEVNGKDNAGNTPLHWTAERGNIDIVRLLIQHGASVNEKNEDGDTALKIAWGDSKTDFVGELMQHGAEVNVKDNAGNTPLHWAAERGYNDTVLLLIQHGASVNEKNKSGETALHMACNMFMKTDTVGELLQHGAEVNVKDKAGNTPLHWAAAEMGNTKTVRLLIQHGASVNEKNEQGETALHMACNKFIESFVFHWAAGRGYTDTVRLLIQHGASVNEKNGDGKTALHSACKYYRTDIVGVLLQHGAVNVKDNAGNTPLHMAAEEGNTDFVRPLIQRGASVNEKNKDGKTALHMACKKYKGTDIVGELLQHGAEVNVKDSSGNTPLHLAAEKGNTDFVRLLIQHGASVNEKNGDGKTALHIACKYYRTDIVGELLQHGAEVNVKDNDGNTPLHMAAEEGNTFCVRLLIQHGASVNEKNKDGKTALHKTCQCKSYFATSDIAGELLRHGAEVNVKDNAGNTPLYIASEQHKTDIVRLLKKHGAV